MDKLIVYQKHILFTVSTVYKSANKKTNSFWAEQSLFSVSRISKGQDGREKQVCNAFLEVSFDVYMFASSFNAFKWV